MAGRSGMGLDIATRHLATIDESELPQLLQEACVRPRGWRTRDRADRQLPLLVLKVPDGTQRAEVARTIGSLCEMAEPCPIPHVTVTLSGAPVGDASDSSQPHQRSNLDLVREAFERLPWPDTLLFRWLRFPRLRLVGGILDFIPYRAARRTKDEVRPQPFSRPERSELRDWLARPSHPANARTDGAREAAHQPRLLGAIPLPIARLVFFLRIHAPVRWLGGPYLWMRTPRTVSLGATTDRSFYTIALKLLGQRYSTPLERFRDYGDLLLVMALLADLRSSFERRISPWGGWARTVYPVLIVDGITRQNLGAELLLELNEVRSRGPWDPLMVIALVDDDERFARLLQGPAQVGGDAGDDPSGGVLQFRTWALGFPGAMPPPGNWFLPMLLTPAADRRQVRDRRVRTRRRPGWTRARYQAIAVAGACLLIAVTAFKFASPVNACINQRSSDAWVTPAADGECVGIVDANASFLNASSKGVRMQDVVRRIVQANAAATASGQYVTILALGPFTAAPGQAIDPSGPLELAGMSFAQESLNRHGNRPQVRILPVNAGADMAYQDHAANEIVRRARQDPTIVGVVGIGQNRPNTQRVVATLAAAGLPMVATTNSVDNAYDSSFYFHVAPTDYREAQVAVQYAGSVRGTLHHGLIVENVDDQYSVELVRDFTSLIAIGGIRALFSAPVDVVPYHAGAGVNDKPNMQAVAQDVCQSRLTRPDFIYYAGRASDLPQFMQQLQLAGCATPNRPFKVISGDDLTTLREGPIGAVTLDYTTLTFPDAWQQCTGDAAPEMLRLFRSSYPDLAPDGLDDGHAVLGNDAVTTAAIAAEQALTDRDKSAPASIQVTAGDVWRELSRSGHPVSGASGDIDVAEAQRIDLTSARTADHRFVAVVERTAAAGPRMVYRSGSLATGCLSDATAP